MPDQLTGTGVVAAELVRGLLASAERAVEPLRVEHARELERLTEEAAAFGEKTLPGRKEITDRHQREERRWRTDALRAGSGCPGPGLSGPYDHPGHGRAVPSPTSTPRRRPRRWHSSPTPPGPWSGIPRRRCCCRPCWCGWVRWRRDRGRRSGRRPQRSSHDERDAPGRRIGFAANFAVRQQLRLEVRLIGEAPDTCRARSV